MIECVLFGWIESESSWFVELDNTRSIRWRGFLGGSGGGRGGEANAPFAY